MAKQDPKETHNAVDNINDSLTSVSQKLQNNKKYIGWAVGAVLVVIGGILAYIYAYRQPKVEQSNAAIGVADAKLMATAYDNDSVKTDTTKLIAEYKAIFDEDGYAAGNLAAVKAAGLLFQQGKTQEALDLINEYDETGSEVVDAAVLAFKGDCYVNLDKYDEALEQYEKAEKMSNNNADYTPYFIVKQARVYEAKKDYKKANELFQKIADTYPDYVTYTEVEYDIARTGALAGK